MFFNAMAAVIAEAEGLDTATVINLGQAARTAGFISKASRGPGAAHMNWTDAANLLIAVNASPSLKEVPATIEKVRSLKLDTYVWLDGILADVRDSATFGESLETLLRASFEQVALERTLFGTMEEFSYGRLREELFLAEKILRNDYKDVGAASLSLQFSQREPKAKLSIETEITKLVYLEWADENSSRQGDLEITASITGATLRKIAKAVKRDEEDR